MKVICFAPGYNPDHVKLLSSFADGCGGTVLPVDKYVDCDVAVIFGTVKNSFAKTKTKGEIMRQHGRPVLMIERGYVRREEYWSAGWSTGGINGHVDFCNADSPPDRWDMLGVNLAPIREDDNSKYVLVCGQVPWDTAVQHTDHYQWVRDTISFYRDELERDVRFRGHPYAIERGADYGFASSTRSLSEDMAGAGRVVTFNSNTGVDAVIAGVSTECDDEGSMVAGLCFGVPLMPYQDEERRRWANKIAYAQWTESEFRDGVAQNHLFRSENAQPR